MVFFKGVVSTSSSSILANLDWVIDCTLLGAIDPTLDLSAYDPKDNLDFISACLDLDDIASKFANLSLDKKLPPLITLLASYAFMY